MSPRDVLWYLTVNTETIDEVVVVAPEGRVSRTTSALFERSLRDAVDGRGRVIVDLAGVDYISSAGFHALADTAARLHARGAELVVCGVQDAVRPAFELAGPFPHLGVESDRESALRVCARRAPAGAATPGDGDGD